MTYQGPAIDDPAILDDLPAGVRRVLASVNGFIQFGGALHIRGASRAIDWHGLRRAWRGPGAFHELYPSVDPHWVPFGEDCVGDQFFLDGAETYRLAAETGELSALDLSFAQFLKAANSDPMGFLAPEPLLQFQQAHGDLPLGHLIHAYPPFCSTDAARGVSLKAVPAWDLHAIHAAFAQALPEDGGTVRIKTQD